MTRKRLGSSLNALKDLPQISLITQSSWRDGLGCEIPRLRWDDNLLFLRWLTTLRRCATRRRAAGELGLSWNGKNVWLGE